jgi:hypothetical protein
MRPLVQTPYYQKKKKKKKRKKVSSIGVLMDDKTFFSVGANETICPDGN